MPTSIPPAPRGPHAGLAAGTRFSLLPLNLLCVSLIVLSAAWLALFLIGQVRGLRAPVERAYGEGHLVWVSQQILDPARTYRKIDSPPFVIVPYPPIYMAVSRAVDVALGDLLMAGRGVSLASATGLVVVAVILVFRCLPVGSPRLWRLASGALAGALIVCTESMSYWASLMRVDMLALLFMFSGLAVYISAAQHPRRHYLAAALFLLAVFTKQTMLSAPLACAVVGMATDRRTALRVLGSATAAGVALLLVLQWASDGGFLTHLVAYTQAPFSWSTALREVRLHLRGSWPTVLGSACAVYGVWSGTTRRRLGWRCTLALRSDRLDDRAVLICGLTAMAAVVGALAIGKMGGARNYFLAWDVSAGLLCALVFFRVLSAISLSRRLRVGGPLLVALAVAFMLRPDRAFYLALTRDYETAVHEEAQLARLLQSTPGPVLSEDLLVLGKVGKALVAEPATVSFLARTGRWDPAPYLRLLDDQYFEVIITSQMAGPQLFSAPMLEAIQRAYQLDRRIGSYWVYRPRKLLQPRVRPDGKRLRERLAIQGQPHRVVAWLRQRATAPPAATGRRGTSAAGASPASAAS
jgi:hypothetical protein